MTTRFKAKTARAANAKARVHALYDLQGQQIATELGKTLGVSERRIEGWLQEWSKATPERVEAA
jgi:hypothetical protein